MVFRVSLIRAHNTHTYTNKHTHTHTRLSLSHSHALGVSLACFHARLLSRSLTLGWLVLFSLSLSLILSLYLRGGWQISSVSVVLSKFFFQLIGPRSYIVS